MTDPVVLMCMPHYSAVSFGAAQAFWHPTAAGSNTRVVHAEYSSSVSPSNFNHALAAALNMRRTAGVSHLAFLHADICPAVGWLDVLLEELERTGADTISAVAPFKSESGLTSIGVSTGDVFCPRRLTLKEVFQLPETFAAEDVERVLGFDGPLLPNTGCFLMNLRRPWVDAVTAAGELAWRFEFKHTVSRGSDGQFYAMGQDESFLLGEHMATVGAVAVATRKVALVHEGGGRWPNTRAWGAATDERFEQVRGQRAAAGV